MLMNALSTTPYHVVGIDYGLHSMIITLPNGIRNPLFDTYLRKVKAVLCVLRIFTVDPTLSQFISESRRMWFSLLENSFLEQTQYQLSDENIHFLKLGVLEGVDRLCSLTAFQLELIAENILAFQQHSSSVRNQNSSTQQIIQYQIVMEVVTVFREVMWMSMEETVQYLKWLDEQKGQKRHSKEYLKEKEPPHSPKPSETKKGKKKNACNIM
jgi:hypothetical protein